MSLNPKILIVDDEPRYHDLVAKVIKSKFKDAEVLAITGGEEAIERVADENFALIFMDFNMAGIDGIKAFKEIRKIRPEQKVCIMTGYIGQKEINTALKEGACAVLKKPFLIKELVKIVEQSIKAE